MNDVSVQTSHKADSISSLSETLARLRGARIAIVHDWLFRMRGGERVLENFCELFPNAEIFTLFFRPDSVSVSIRRQQITTSRWNSLPFIAQGYRHLLPIYPNISADLGEKLKRRGPFDLVISISHCAAKNIPIPEGVKHLCYCLTPMRYLWDQFEAYFPNGLKRAVAAKVFPKLRAWDIQGAHHVDKFVAISNFVATRIGRVYGVGADVIYPPVRSDWIAPRAEGAQGNGFLCVNALVPYKRTGAIIDAFNKLGEKLTVIGTGPEESKLRRQANSNIEFIPWCADRELAQRYRDARGLVFAAEEDFGITPVEMQAAGRPVIAWGRGGALETIETTPGQETGVFYQEPTGESIYSAVQHFLENEGRFTVKNCLENAARFSPGRFCSELLFTCGRFMDSEPVVRC